MPLTVTTDHAEITAVLGRYLAAEPVRYTILGTIGTSLEDTAWAVLGEHRLAVRSGATYPVVFAGDWSKGENNRLIDLLGQVPDLRGLCGPAEVVRPVWDGLGRAGRVMEQRLFRCDELVPPAGVAGRARRAGADDADVVREYYRAFMDEEGDGFGDAERSAAQAVAEGGCWLWCDPAGAPVSLAVRRPVVAGSARVGPVYTPPAARGNGYGSGVTAAATRDVLDDGAVPALFTDLANPTSNKIYQLLGYRPVEDRLIVTFT